MRRLLALLAVAAMVAAACGGNGDEGDGKDQGGRLTPLRFILSFRPNSDVVPYAVGLQRGYYEDEGLDVTVLEATDPTSPLKTIASGRDQMGYAFGPDLMFTAEEGLPIQSVYAVLQTASFGIISLAEANIGSVEDLAGKRVGITSIPIDQISMDAMLASAGLDRDDLSVIDVGFTGQEALLAGKVDAISSITWGEGATYDVLGKDWNFLYYYDHGVPDYQFEVIVANRTFLEENPDTVRAFLRATTKAMQFALDNPEEAVDDLLAQYPDLADTKDEKLAVWNAFAEDVVSPLTEENGLGYQDPNQWEAVADFFVESQLITSKPDLSTVYTNDYYKG